MKTIEEILSKLPEDIREPITEAFQIFKNDLMLKELKYLREDINELRKIVTELAEAQNRTEAKLNQLAEAQNRTEERLNQLAERVNQLAEAQNRTEAKLNQLAERVNQLAEAQNRTEAKLNQLAERVNQLAEAQNRTEERLNKLAEAQNRTEERLNQLAERVNQLAEAQNRTEVRLNELAEAQKRTETELRKLTVEHRKTRENLGGLAHAFGHILEDRAIKSLPKILKINYGMEAIEDFKRDYLKVGEEYIELNIYGKVKKDGKEYYVIGEAKSRLSKRFIDDFIKKCDRISKNSFKIIISYLFPPLVKQYAQEKGIILISSYELEH